MASEEATVYFPAINVIPPMFNWKPEAAEKARQKGAFLRVGGKQVTRRYLSGAKRAWASSDPQERDSIYNTQYRITGTPDNVRQALLYAQYSPEVVEGVIADSINRNNYQTTKRDEYEREIASRDGLKKSQKVQTDSGYNWAQLTWFAQNIKSAVTQTKTGETRAGVASPGRRKDTDLASRVTKLGPNEVLDVSAMDVNTGTGARKIDRPRTSKAAKYGTIEIPIVSNNIESYAAALRMIYGAENYEQYKGAIEATRNAIAQHATKPAPNTLPMNPPVPVPVPQVQLAGSYIANPPNLVPVPQQQAIAPPPLAQVPQLTQVPSVASPVSTYGNPAGAAQIPAFSTLQNQ